MNIKMLFDGDEVPNDVAVIDTLKKSALPVVLYGAKVDVADRIAEKLSRNHINVAWVVSDEDAPVMTSSTLFLKDTEIISIKELDERLPAYQVILGFVKGYGNISAVTAKFKNAESVSYLSEIFDMEVIRPSFVHENRVFLEELYENLLDQHSKDSFVAYLLSKTRQDMKYLPPVFDRIQYFPNGMFEFSAHESYFDCGAFTGDTIEEFLKATGGLYRHIWAAEPDRSNYKRLMEYVGEKKLSDIDVINKGIYAYAGRLPFREDGSMLSMISDDADHYIEVDTIDRITGDHPVTYIKMDVEGVELMALKGAEQTIRRDKPVLGISVYHKERDLIDIPQYIKEIVPEYKFYFRVHKKIAIDTILYAVIK
ncbi:MAG: FkbM family methyltransferase [Tannerella sp.]|jgi:FkbM family methyltransferase|nr:FkbM family methyltransferase [Tannerella sp.]